MNFDDLKGTGTLRSSLPVGVFQKSTPASSAAPAKREESGEKRSALTAPFKPVKTARHRLERRDDR
jgi:hypothetical protein